MPIDYSKYDPKWKTEIRPAVLERAQHCCEQCGAANYKPNPVTGSTVVLTVAHLDHDVTNNAMSNLKALCQLCHNRLDAKMRARHAKETRRKKARCIQLELIF